MIRRTTLAADSADLAVLEAEARRRDVSLATVLREVIAEGAAARRSSVPRPRWGLFHGPGDLAQQTVDDEDAPWRSPVGS